MAKKQSDLLAELQARELVAQWSGGDEFADHLSTAPRSVYCGFDPTAESLHIGSLVPLLAMRRFQLAGHAPIALVGGATGLIGDPSFKAQERQLNTGDTVAAWVESIRGQLEQFIDFDAGAASARVVNNLDWMQSMDVLTFLRDIGKHFSINAMVQKEAVKQRIEREGSGISYTEFSYMILQSYDFAELNKRHGCSVQIGGSDQWGNITGGIDLARRLNKAQVYGLTLPLVTKSDGTKFGKTESGTIWLSPAKTSPYAFYQFWLNTADADAYKFLRYFSFRPVSEIEEIYRADQASGTRPAAQQCLADDVTRLVHGEEGLTAARQITEALFSGELRELDEAALGQLAQDGLPYARIERSALGGQALTGLLPEIGMVKSGKQVKDALGRGGLQINGEVVGADENMAVEAVFAKKHAFYGRYYVLKLGKKNYQLLEID